MLHLVEPQMCTCPSLDTSFSILPSTTGPLHMPFCLPPASTQVTWDSSSSSHCCSITTIYGHAPEVCNQVKSSSVFSGHCVLALLFFMKFICFRNSWLTAVSTSRLQAPQGLGPYLFLLLGPQFSEELPAHRGHSIPTCWMNGWL